MEFIAIMLIAAAVFAVCYLVDTSFTTAFRRTAQHRSGKAVRAPKRYGIFGVLLTVVGILAICVGVTDGWVLLGGGTIVLLMGIGLAVYYLSFGVFYNDDSILYARLGKKDVTYEYRQILGQKLYVVQGGSIVVELHMADGSTVSLQSTMDGVYPFLDAAFAAWCAQTGRDPEKCDFHDPSQSLWFPTVEET